MTEKSLFTRIIDREIPSEIVFEDELCIAIRDISPQAPLHVLVVPKKPIAKLSDGTADDAELIGHLMLKAAAIASDEGFEDFRVVVNNGAAAGQSVFHLHVHVLAGRGLNWPPG
ncbi:MAG: histidine triad nucleotide-binding protein [Gammaproteobacteria bacterium]|nr:histidine triad nucleotide-binding protein [Gammaproteobacteria bacterium]MDH3768908.1 histidine triad nucleotide-binding protein [Gammaproteobacteria bacterium]